MKNILVAVDLSETSLNLLRYVRNAHTDDNVSILHVTQGMLAFESPEVDPAVMSKEKVIEKEVRNYILDGLNLQTFSNRIRLTVEPGEPVATIKKYATNYPFDAIYIGSRDNYDALDRWIGTTTLGVVKTATIPVYVIPPQAHYQGYEKVLVASDAHIAQAAHLQHIKTWNQTHRAYMKFVHVREHPSDHFAEEGQRIVQEMYEKEEPDFGFEVDLISGENIAKTLLDARASLEADLMIVISAKQSFLQSLIFESTSKDLILQSTSPILFIPSQ